MTANRYVMQKSIAMSAHFQASGESIGTRWEWGWGGEAVQKVICSNNILPDADYNNADGNGL